MHISFSDGHSIYVDYSSSNSNGLATALSCKVLKLDPCVSYFAHDKPLGYGRYGSRYGRSTG